MWEQVKKKGVELREKELLDYHLIEVSEEEKKNHKKKKKIMSRIKEALQQIHIFQYLTRYVGKWQRDTINRLHKVNDKEQIIETYIDN